MPRREEPADSADRPWIDGGDSGRLLGLILVLLLVSGGPAWARRQKTVFHGLPAEPETGLKPGQASEPIALAPVLTFDGFEAPLAGDPVVSDATLIAADRAGRVAAIDPSGVAAGWRVDLAEPLSTGPAAMRKTIFQATSGGVLVALDSRDGREIWRVPLGGSPVAPPQPAIDRLLVVTDAPALLALRPEDGAVLGRIPLPGKPVAPGMAGDAILVGTDHGMVVAVDAPTFTVRWRRYLRHSVTAPPLVHDRRVYVALSDRSLRCLRLKSGRQLWGQRTGSVTGARLLPRNDLLYALCYDNDIYVLRLKSGHLVGRVRLDHRLSQDGAATDEYLFVAPFTEGTVIGLDFPFLGMAGRFRLDAPGEWFTTRPVVLAGGRLAVGYGRDAGRVLVLSVTPGVAPSKAEAGTGAGPSR